MTAGGSTYMPLRVNMAGVIPIIFAAARDGVPADDRPVLPDRRRASSTSTSRRTSLPYLLLEGVLIVVFTYFYTAVQFNPVDQADNLRKYGGYIPGIRPGPPTAQYLDRVLTRLTLPGSLYLAIVAVAAEHLHPLLRLLAGDLARPRRHLGADRRRRRARHDAPDGVADDDALLRRLPEVASLRREHPPARAPGVRQGNAGEADRRRVRDPAHRDGRHPARRDRRRHASSGRKVKPISTRGAARARRADDRPDPRAARRSTTPSDGLRPRRLPAHDAAGRGARRDARARSTAELDVVFELQLPDDGRASSGCSSARAEEGRADDTPEAIDERLAIYHRETEPLVEHYRARGNVVGIHADRAGRRGLRRDPGRARAGGGPMIIRKIAGRDRADGARRAGRRRDARAGRRARPAGRHDAASSTSSRRSSSARAAASRLQGLPRLSRLDLHVAERDGRPRHPRPVRARATATCSRSTSA